MNRDHAFLIPHVYPCVLVPELNAMLEPLVAIRLVGSQRLVGAFASTLAHLFLLSFLPM